MLTSPVTALRTLTQAEREAKQLLREPRGAGAWIYRLRQCVEGRRPKATAIRTCHRILWRRKMIHSPDRSTLEPTRLGRAVYHHLRQLLDWDEAST